jgi:hypothetical protein
MVLAAMPVCLRRSVALGRSSSASAPRISSLRSSKLWREDVFWLGRVVAVSSVEAYLQGFSLWARLDSNQGPTDYESAALTN